MGRKKIEINIKSGNRLRELLKENGFTQQRFAEKFGYSEQHVSLLVTGKRRLTPEAAALVAAMYPPVRFEWLMGFDDYKTLASKKNSEYSKVINEGKMLMNAVEMISYTAGYEIVLFDSTDESGNGKIEDVLRNINEGYKIYHDGKMVATCSVESFGKFANMIFQYTDFMLQKLIRTGDATSAK